MSKKQVFQFLDAPREMPRKLPLALRTAGDWNELYGAFAQPEASHQAGRLIARLGGVACRRSSNRYDQWASTQSAVK